MMDVLDGIKMLHEDRETISYNMLNRRQKQMYIAQVKNSAKVHKHNSQDGIYDEFVRGCHYRNCLADLATLRLLLSQTLYLDFIGELESS